MTRYWHYASELAPSRAIERDRVTDTLAVLGVPPGCWAELSATIHARGGPSVIMTPDIGWGDRATYEPTMLMSFYDGAADHAVSVIAAPAAVGELYRAACQGSVYHVAHWPICGNLARLTLSEGEAEPGPILPADPVTVSEPSMVLLLALGVVLMWWMTAGGAYD